ncbi:TetR family transcriptional regulator [Glutamicibacter sp. NPDC087344]|uniref:TetR/AcrR family transcriptional regulator n=1 Tax=Glutamicibacter sp. NPDC087344 TaxID=3363994 RepID=UPI003806C569
MASQEQARTGRRPGSSSSRQDILTAARALFTERGYKGATIRAIAAQAGTDTTLIRHYFGDKDNLFATAMQVPEGFGHQLLRAIEGDLAGMGERLTRTYLSLWEDPEISAPLRAMVVSSFTNQLALEKLRGFLVATLLEPAARKIPGEDPQLRLLVTGSHLLGIAIARHFLHAPVLSEASLERIVELVSPAIQGYLDGGSPSPAA